MNYSRSEFENCELSEDLRRMYINSCELSEKFSKVIEDNYLMKGTTFRERYDTLDESKETTLKRVDCLDAFGDKIRHSIDLDVVLELLDSIETKEDLMYIFGNRSFESIYDPEPYKGIHEFGSYSVELTPSSSLICCLLDRDILTQNHINRFNKLLELPKTLPFNIHDPFNVHNRSNPEKTTITDFIDYLEFSTLYTTRHFVNTAETPDLIEEKYRKMDENFANEMLTSIKNFKSRLLTKRPKSKGR